MPRQEQIQPRKSRTGVESVSTFPEKTEPVSRRVSGGPEGGDDLLLEIDEVLSRQPILRQLGHIGIEA